MPDRSNRVDDLRGCSFEQFLSYAFDRPAPLVEGGDPWWYEVGLYDVALLVDSELQLDHATTLFTEPLVVRGRFTPAQIDQGFWFLSFANESAYGRFFAEILSDEAVDLAKRRTVVAAMFHLYDKLFARFPTQTATLMWWDNIATFFNDRESGSDDPVRREMITTLGRILMLDAEHCQAAALHGLNHLGTQAERTALIEPFFRERAPDEKLRQYALQCMSGSAM